MAVYTPVSLEELNVFLQQYNIGEPLKFRGITQGVTNTNYYLRTTSGRYVVTIFEHRMKESELPVLMNILLDLSKNGYPCPTPITANNGEVLTQLKGKPAAIQSFMDGETVSEITPELCTQLGAWLARLHRLTRNVEQCPEDPVPPEVWKNLITSVEADDWKDVLLPELDFLIENWPSDIPTGFVHGDLYPDNVLAEKDYITGIIDFNYSCRQAYIYDLALCLNSWCFEDNGTEFNKIKGGFLMKSYQSARPLEPEEKSQFSIAARGAAMRVIATRYYDWFNTPEGADVVKKSPEDHINMLKFHQSIEDPISYGIL